MPMTFTIIQSHVQYKLFSQVEAYKVIFAVIFFYRNCSCHRPLSCLFRWCSIYSVSCCVADFYALAEMRLVILGSRPLLALTLMLALTCLKHLCHGAMPFPQDLEPISTVGSERKYETMKHHLALQFLG